MEIITDTPRKYHYIPKGSDEMGISTRGYIWSKISLGAPGKMPPRLCKTVPLLLSCKFPMFLWWGTDLIQFHNNAYRPSLGNNGEHPNALGQKAKECRPEIWHIIYPFIKQVIPTRDASWSEDQLVPKNVPCYLHSTNTVEKIITEANNLGAVGFTIKQTSLESLIKYFNGSFILNV